MAQNPTHNNWNNMDVKFGMSYCLPALPVTLPLLYHPDFERLKEDVSAWVRPFVMDVFNETEGYTPRSDRYLGEGHLKWAGMVYPHCLPERALPIQGAMVWLTLLDDAFTAANIQINRIDLLQRLLHVIDGTVTPISPLEKMTAAVQEIMFQHPPASMKPRLRNQIKDVLISAASETIEDVTTTFDSIADYLQYRRTNIFGIYVLTLTEWALGLDLQQYVDGDHDLALARDLVIDHFSLVNDIYSFPKEIEAGETTNSVWILMKCQGLSLQAALDQLAQRAVDTESHFIIVRDRILAGPLNRNSHIEDYLRELAHAIPGNLRFHRQTSRYHGFTRALHKTDAGNTVPEPVTLYHRYTVHSSL